MLRILSSRKFATKHCRAGCLTLLIGTTSAATTFRLSRDTPLPADILALDVRWSGPDEVLIGIGKGGVVRTPVASAPRFSVVVPAADKGGFVLSAMLGLGTRHVVLGAPFGVWGWTALQSSSASPPVARPLAAVMDVDARGDRVAVLGADRGDVQGLAADGAIAWVGSLSKGGSDLRPLMRGRASPGGKDMARCAFLETGAIRFMPDGSLIVVPGVEPGVYRYDASGKLLQTWQTDPLGVVDECAIDASALVLLARDFEQRTKWLAARVTVDDILPLRDGPALLLRRVMNGVTHWDVVELPYRGQPQKITLPVTMPTPRAHARGDVRGNQLALVVFDYPMPKRKPEAASRLVLLSISP